jgi:hypothetical protein
MAIVRLEVLGQLKKIHLIGTRTRDLLVCSIVPQPTMLPRAAFWGFVYRPVFYRTVNITFQILDLSSGKEVETSALSGPLERATHCTNLGYLFLAYLRERVFPPSHLRTETGTVSETL